MSHLLEGSAVAGTSLVAKESISVAELLSALGPQLGTLYEELTAVEREVLGPVQQRQRDWLLRTFRLATPEEREYVTEWRE